jgi:hypothetical protein
VTMTDLQIYAVHPSRLAPPAWNGEMKKQAGGDIYGSYSGDTICDSSKIRAPFAWQDCLWVCVGLETGGGEAVKAKAYRLIPRRFFDEPPTTYRQKTDRDHGDGARRDPKGFYHGMTVSERGETYVLTAVRLNSPSCLQSTHK